MAEVRNSTGIIDKSLERIIALIDSKKSFILEAGAGSGKTWTLIESLKHVIRKYEKELIKNGQRIICITYTNVASDEIKERIDRHPSVIVSTIHDFLWDVIKPYQTELKEGVLLLDRESGGAEDNLEELLTDVKIHYSQYGRNFPAGQISHDEVIKLALYLFSKHPKIARIVSAKCPFIFVDEYQDTQPETVELLVDHLLTQRPGCVVIGFFGDSMQQIYGTGVGGIQRDLLEQVPKKDNFRCSKEVIKLLNKIRPELVQAPSGRNKTGEISFFQCNSRLTQHEENFQQVINHLRTERAWELKPEDTKILMLTHKIIAKRLDYTNLLETYQILSQRYGRDKLFDRDEPFAAFFIDKVELLVEHYDQGRYGRFVRLLGEYGYKLANSSDKKKLLEQMDELNRLRKESTVREVLDNIKNAKLISVPHQIYEFESMVALVTDESEEKIQKKANFFNALMDLRYAQFVAVTQFIHEYTPFSTKHGVKGAEYDNVLVVIDDNAWNQYKDNDVFAGNVSNQVRYNRTRNLLYVCCSRAKDKLAVLSLTELDGKALSTIKDWFGEDNVYDIANI